MGDRWINAPIRCTIKFDNGMSYVVYMGEDATDDKYINGLLKNGNDAELAGNPLGIITSGDITLYIMDAYNRLMKSNDDSPYYGYMGYGVEIQLEISYDDGVTYVDYGTYYSTGWDTDISDGYNDMTEITASDRLQYIGMQDIPKLPAYSGITAKELLVNLFTALGFQAGEYYIDPSLNLDIKFGITVGSKVRDVLNQIAQVLIARIRFNRYGVLEVIQAYPTWITGSTAPTNAQGADGNRYFDTTTKYVYIKNNGVWSRDMDVVYIDDIVLSKLKSKHNTAMIYNQVEVQYIQLGNSAVNTLLRVSGITLKTGVNDFYGLKFNGKTLDIEDVYFETAYTIKNGSGADEVVSLTNISYQGYQDGADVHVTNNTSVPVVCNLVIEGRLLDTITASESSNIIQANKKISNKLTIKTDVVQDSATAKSIANNIANYMSKSGVVNTMDTIMTEKAVEGDTVIVDLSDNTAKLNGVHRLLNYNATHGINYNKYVTLLKVV
jgi:hypothetical protein